MWLLFFREKIKKYDEDLINSKKGGPLSLLKLNWLWNNFSKKGKGILLEKDLLAYNKRMSKFEIKSFWKVFIVIFL
jgi:hypothetical protein